MELYQIQIYYKNYEYDHLFLNNAVIFTKNENFDQIDYASGDFKILDKKKLKRIGGIVTHYFIQELYISKNYRSSFINLLKYLGVNVLFIKLQNDREMIDYKGYVTIS